MSAVIPPADVDAAGEVRNQSPPRVDVDEFAADLPLREAVSRYSAGWAQDHLGTAGRLAGSARFHAWAEQAEERPPRLHTHDRVGRRIDEVRYDAAYHQVMAAAVGLGAHALSWQEARPGAQVARSAVHMLLAQTESGHACPITMTHAAVPALRAQPDLAAEWVPRLTTSDYDPRPRPAAGKSGALMGMGMTERQGGSDVRSNTTRARRAGGDGEYLLTGHKWFFSAPMSDAFLVLAQTDAGPTCFLLPRFLPDGSRNALRLQRLKDKLGNRSNASGEVEFDGAWARLVGEPGAGVRTIIEMVNHTRLDCVGGTAALMRRAVVEACHHARHRHAFGAALVDQPLMTSVLADLCVESEAATSAMLRLARTYDVDATEQDRHLRRLGTAVLKYWVCKRGPGHAFEAMEALGGNGYCEDFPLARVYREQPLTSIWEGSGNVICLDVLRALTRTPETGEAFLAEIELARGGNRSLDTHLDLVRRDLAALPADPAEAQRQARMLVERLALAFQGALLVRHAPAEVSDAFCGGRLDGGRSYGTLPVSVAARVIVDRHTGAVESPSG
ncbi:putative acyl-CoA dehydrogenase [Actinoalloteichus hoggarensis]|uniref:Putative acyl-CoA dehydrogenase AidB n=1 Tax=Actinoalloteichus hoggarensis TaxID=1470176 RepID=A0A221W3Q5_9PSEU|nr:acyl-CoA dehydrogenase family protein [Actinoalloteichus hoggarensis]ASO20438.1 Putative acyl-CoA dehydrogenase AidB [Actinoalloteichus hoggarensis]MBB5923477.1 putative acyl-CoA dehydrogenase [Actinoalloteichus hoggarensis]